ncbi:ZIP family metal transporter [Planctomicrobium sp.]|jgi:zinc and cadmium transporter|nr:ZIP family metal transporter [Planctomicrobium sp.]MDA7503565.1 ZIP family metal transporter [bacterium]MDB4733069.1 ZIP family metal transporter [Planctomicrobium sp.]
MSSLTVLAVYCVLIVAASLLGGRLPTLVKLDHKRMQILISFVGGLMLGIGLFHMLPHAIVMLGIYRLDRVVVAVMLGMVVMFFLLRMFHFHHHDPEQLPQVEACDHEDHHHDHAGHSHHDSLTKDMSWMGVFVGLSLHTMVDGFALGASIQADAMHQNKVLFLGLGTFVAILLHKPLDALSITSLMRASKWSGRSQFLVNGTFALMCPLGAFLFLTGAGFLEGQQTEIVGSMLAFAAGVFICIALSDLLPEMEFHSHHRVPLSLALLAGIALAWMIRYLEPVNVHSPNPGTTIQLGEDFQLPPIESE